MEEESCAGDLCPGGGGETLLEGEEGEVGWGNWRGMGREKRGKEGGEEERESEGFNKPVQLFTAPQ